MEPLRDCLSNTLRPVAQVYLNPDTLSIDLVLDQEDSDDHAYKCLVCRDTGIVRHQFVDQFGRDWAFACYCPAGYGIGGETHQGISLDVYQKLLVKEREKHGIRPF